ncbi:MAG: efflux RND transporter periplasmic adaptor subunit [Alkalispirochaetaceae bacterium]
MNSRAVVVLLSLAVVLSGCSREESPTTSETEERRVPVEVLRVVERPFTVYGDYYGEVTGINEVELITVAGGRVNAIDVEVGDQVSAGDSLARIDGEKALRQYETALFNERLALEDFERQRRFLDEGNSFQLAVDQAELALLRSRTALLDAERVREGALAITPIDGTVVTRDIDLFEEVAPGESTFMVSDLSRMKVRLGVPEDDIAGIRNIDGEAEVRFTAFPGRVWDGEVVSFARRRSEGTLTFQVEVHVENPEGLLLSGTTARVRLPLRTIEQSVVVPSSSLVTRGDGAYLVVADGELARLRPVVLGPSDERETVILEGVQPGEQIVVRGINQVDDGTPIRVLDRQDA